MDGTNQLSVIAGAGGMGKTWLALKWAHQHRDLFPGGQLFVNLRGFEPSLDRMAPYQAMRGFLLAFQIAPDRIPDDPEAMTGLYHSVLADKRLLIVIDNARDAEQVSALVPGSASCSMVITSRNRLTSLVTSHNANLLTLDVLNAEDARQLLTARLGPGRTAAEPAALGQLSEACGGLPLALAITVGRAQEHPDFPLASLVAELRDAGSTLNALDVGTDLSVRAVLSTSHAARSAPQADLALALADEIGPPDIRVSVIDTLGYIAFRTGQLDEAVSYLSEAAKFMSGPHSRGELAHTLYTLGRTYTEPGRLEEARDNLEQALRLYREQHRIDNVRETEKALAQLAET